MLWIRSGAVRYSHGSWPSPYSVPRIALGGCAGCTRRQWHHDAHDEPPLDRTSPAPAPRPAPTARTRRRSTTSSRRPPALPPRPARWSSSTAASGASSTTASTRARGPGLRGGRLPRRARGVPPSRYAGWRRPRHPRRRARPPRVGLVAGRPAQAARPRRPLRRRTARHLGGRAAVGPRARDRGRRVAGRVVDLGAADRMHLGSDATRDFVGSGPGTDAWTSADPMSTLPPKVPVSARQRRGRRHRAAGRRRRPT